MNTNWFVSGAISVLLISSQFAGGHYISQAAAIMVQLSDLIISPVNVSEGTGSGRSGSQLNSLCKEMLDFRHRIYDQPMEKWTRLPTDRQRLIVCSLYTSYFPNKTIKTMTTR
ncbi:hypothetical protein K9N68_23005 [Kovacikia minuta CCNUW1]|uniref:hypothetical protein n=1 Tax=Kovacikia minuta TaxID=2931930 RepID=UPI001CCB8B4F|nr:hypothetical protein [Kovacikia minuta]UBF24540.1 hypothetical protein K9N68_23005 [Kovacikia minuta CCNUW1]